MRSTCWSTGNRTILPPPSPQHRRHRPASTTITPRERSAAVAALLFELGDTSDDMPDHCKPDARPLRIAPPPASPLPTPQLHEPQRCTQPLLRPPRV